jgi:hypothetical protein
MNKEIQACSNSKAWSAVRATTTERAEVQAIPYLLTAKRMACTEQFFHVAMSGRISQLAGTYQAMFWQKS